MIASRSPQNLRINNVMKHSASKNYEVNEDEELIDKKSPLYRDSEDNPPRRLTQMCPPYQRNNISISPSNHAIRKKSLFSRGVFHGKNHQEVIIKSENQELDMPHAMDDS
jgi:hypothetical protein